MEEMPTNRNESEQKYYDEVLESEAEEYSTLIEKWPDKKKGLIFTAMLSTRLDANIESNRDLIQRLNVIRSHSPASSESYKEAETAITDIEKANEAIKRAANQIRADLGLPPKYPEAD